MKWHTIPGTFNSYSVSDTGLIRRDKPVKGNHKAGQVISSRLDRYGYPQVCLCVNGTQKTTNIHRLVALAFLGSPPSKGLQVNHKNGIKTDNRPSNLEWGTVRHNLVHALKTGLRVNAKGSRVGGSKLTENAAREIIDRSKTQTQRSLAKEFGVSEAAISLLLNGKTWGHVLAPDLNA